MRLVLKDLRMLGYLLAANDRRKFAALLFLMLVASVMEAAGIALIPLFVSVLVKPSLVHDLPGASWWGSTVGESLTPSLLGWLSLALMIFILAKNALLIVLYYQQAKISMEQWVRLASRVFIDYQNAPYEWYLQRSTPEIMRNVQSDTKQAISGVVMPYLNLIMALSLSLGVLLVLVVSMPAVVFCSVLFMGLCIMVVIRAFRNQLSRIGVVQREGIEQISKAIIQGFGALVDARILGTERFLANKFQSAITRQAGVNAAQIAIQKSIPYIIETITVLGFLVILAIMLLLASSEKDVLPIIAMLGVAVLRLKQMASQIASAISSINTNRPYLPGIVRDLRVLAKVGAGVKGMQEPGELAIDRFEYLELSNVSYKYPSRSEMSLDSVSLKLSRGESIAIVGETGSGKSTLLSVILGLLIPSSGAVCFNGRPIERSLLAWRKNLGYIPQSIYLVDDSVRANVAFGVPDNEIDANRVWRAVRAANLEELVESLPLGLDTQIGERGVRLSGGQRQRLGIARALYKDADVIVMDEATSALDSKTEMEVMEAINKIKEDRSVIIVAHRLSTVANCDRIYLLDHGGVSDVGTFEELRAESIGFRKMAMMPEFNAS